MKHFEIVIEYFDCMSETSGMAVRRVTGTLDEAVVHAKKLVKGFERGSKVVDAARVELVSTENVVWTLVESP
jgi:hypothetical protein